MTALCRDANCQAVSSQVMALLEVVNFLSAILAHKREIPK
jgi:hypothetical protein